MPWSWPYLSNRSSTSSSSDSFLLLAYKETNELAKKSSHHRGNKLWSEGFRRFIRTSEIFNDMTYHEIHYEIRNVYIYIYISYILYYIILYHIILYYNIILYYIYIILNKNIKSLHHVTSRTTTISWSSGPGLTLLWATFSCETERPIGPMGINKEPNQDEPWWTMHNWSESMTETETNWGASFITPLRDARYMLHAKICPKRKWGWPPGRLAAWPACIHCTCTK